MFQGAGAGDLGLPAGLAFLHGPSATPPITQTLQHRQDLDGELKYQETTPAGWILPKGVFILTKASVNIKGFHFPNPPMVE